MSPNDTDDTGELRGRADRDGRLPDDADARLERFVRNRYFTGKLMTARDMLTEQDYHGDRLETLTQRVAGRGAVCGLSIDVEQPGENEPLEISVEPGYALDCCGRPVLLDTTAHETVQPEDLPDPTEPREGELPHGIAIYIRLKECFTEKVPVNGSEDACREDCTYNRVVEDFAIVTDQNDPAVKRVNRLSFPTRADLESYDPEQGPTPDDPGLQIPAETYNEDPTREGFQHHRCPEEGDPRVFLGYYAVDDTDWWRVEDAAPRHYVYSNDMLYAAIVRHAVDFENPHDVLVRVDEYVRDKVLKYAIETFFEVAERYAELDGDFAEEVTARTREIILAARDALDAGYFRNRDAFTITGVYLAALAWALRGTLQEGIEDDPELVSEESLSDYSAAFEFLWDPLTEPYMDIVHDRDRAEELWEDLVGGESPDEILTDLNGEPDATELAVVLDQIVEAAGWLELGEEPAQITLPGAEEAIDARIIETAMDRRGDGIEGIDELRQQLDELTDRLNGLESRHERDIERLTGRLTRLEQYVMERSVSCKCSTFAAVADRFDSEVANEIVERTEEFLDGFDVEERIEPREYFDFISRVLELEEEALIDELDGQIDDESFERLQKAVRRLQIAFEERDEENVLPVATAQNNVCMRVQCLVTRGQIG